MKKANRPGFCKGCQSCINPCDRKKSMTYILKKHKYDGVDEGFQELLSEIMNFGVEVNTRNSVCRRIRNQEIVFDSTPLVSIRKTSWKSAIREFEWFMSGSCNIDDLHPSVHKWWKPWANETGVIPNNYSVQFRNFAGMSDSYTLGFTDQIQYLMDAIKNHPFSRRSVISTWNTTDMISKNTPITNCHGTVIQAFVDPDNTTKTMPEGFGPGKLHLIMYQRSSDMVLGMQHNWIQYWAFLLYLAHHCGREVGTLTWKGGDCHVYETHYEATRDIYTANTTEINTPKLIYTPSSTDFKADDFSLEGDYKPVIVKSLPMVV